MIQARHISFNIEYGRYIKPIEDRLCGFVQFGKGTNLNIASKIYSLSKRFTHYTEIDHTTFDAHVTKEMLQLTHTYYQSCYFHNKELRLLSKKTLNNACKTRTKIKYRVKGTRMSGDVDTSLGNSLINYAILKEVISKLYGKTEIIVNGDDSIIFTNRGVEPEILKTELLKYNMESKVQESVTNIHKVEFCKNRLVINSKGRPTLMINPSRLTSIYGMTYRQTNDYVEYLRQVCVCNIAMNISNPLAQYWSLIYKENFTKKLNLLEIINFDKIELQTKIIAINELKHTPISEYDSGEFNSTTYCAWGNLDYMLVHKDKINKKIKKINSVYRDVRINTSMIKYLPVNTWITIDHNRQRINVE